MAAQREVDPMPRRRHRHRASHVTASGQRTYSGRNQATLPKRQIQRDMAKQILRACSDGGFRLNEENLDYITNGSEFRDKPVILISVAGAFRKGKSFLLDMMLRYLTAPDKTNWLNWRDTDRAGFPWQCGYRRHTTGILMWSQPFPVTLSTGEEAVILLMDTQGTFDNHSTIHESSVVFALSTLLSSLQIFNLMGNLQNNDLEHLQLFTEYGRMALDEGSNKPFQKLLFLVRDWQYFDDLPLGEQGGRKLVEEWLQGGSNKEELVNVRKHIRACFTDIGGFLLPHPGPKVASSPKFDGAAKDMDPRFAEGLTQFMPMVLSAARLDVKTIAGNHLKVRELGNFMRTYVQLFRKSSLPKPKTLFTATAETNNMTAVLDAKNQYITEMKAIVDDNEHSIEDRELSMRHRQAVLHAQNAFTDRKKMGDQEMTDRFLVKLIRELDTWFKTTKRVNSMKREKETLEAFQLTKELIITCKQHYVKRMQSYTEVREVLHTSEMSQAHTDAKSEALSMFQDNTTVLDNIAEQGHFELTEAIEESFRRALFQNEVKKNIKDEREAKNNMAAVRRAKEKYTKTMSELGNEHCSQQYLRGKHEKALTEAMNIFDDYKEGSPAAFEKYTDSLRQDLEHELTEYVQFNEGLGEAEQMQSKIDNLESEVEVYRNESNEEECVIL